VEPLEDLSSRKITFAEIDNVVGVTKQDVIEFVAGGEINMGHVVGGTHTSLTVRMPHEQVVAIDCGQIISVWNDLKIEQWPEIIQNATVLLNELSSSSQSNLEEFWKLCHQRSSSIPIDSLDLAIFLFQRHKFRQWLNPNIPASQSYVFVPTPVQRYVAAILMFNNPIYFKRRCSSRTFPEDVAADAIHLDGIGETIHHIRPGGYSLCGKSQVNNHLSSVFSSFCENHDNNSILGQMVNDFELLKVINVLESYSRGSSCDESLVKCVANKLGQPLTVDGVKNILQKLNSKQEAISFQKLPVDQTPWTNSILESSKVLVEMVASHRMKLKESKITGAKHQHKPISIDTKGSALLDDAFSFSPETNELLVHITDVYKFLSPHGALLATAKERKQAVSCSGKTMHLLPPIALKAISLSSDEYNDVLTIAFTLDFSTGRIVSHRVYNSTIQPVVTVDVGSANVILAGADFDPITIDQRYTPDVIRDIQDFSMIAERLCATEPWLDYKFSKTKTIPNKHDGAYRIINTFLTLYSAYAHQYCLDRGIPVPVAWENRDRLEPSRIRRCATSPLRNWLSMVQQQQLRAALNLNHALSKQECASIVRGYKST
jgi:hypothetical protein